VNEDFLDPLEAFQAAGVRFLVVGAHAMAVHGVPRATGDLDVWVSSDEANARLAWGALVRFGAPVPAMGVSEADLRADDTVVQIGLPPRRIDVLTSVSGLSFDEAWAARVSHDLGRLNAVPVLGREDLLRNKRASGRTKDLADVELLERGRD
jgi:hypothetical protein